MLALIAGRGALPLAVAQAQARPALVCALEGSEPTDLAVDHVFCLERLGGFIVWLKAQGVTHLCLCGAVDRPGFRPWRLDLHTVFLLPRIRRALAQGDDGALRIAMNIFEEAGLTIVAAHEAAPALLPAAGSPTKVKPDDTAWRAALQGDKISTAQGAEDLGQASIVNEFQCIAREDARGTDAMLAGLDHAQVAGAVFYKAPKPGQDRRADLPVIGPETAERAIGLGLTGLVIEAGGVMVLGADEVIRRLDAAGLFLWVRERPE